MYAASHCRNPAASVLICAASEPSRVMSVNARVGSAGARAWTATAAREYAARIFSISAAVVVPFTYPVISDSV